MSMTRSETFWSYVVVEKYMDENGIDYKKAYEALAKEYDDSYDELQSKLAIAVEALEFIANDGYSSTSEDGIPDRSEFWNKARQALEKIR